MKLLLILFICRISFAGPALVEALNLGQFDKVKMLLKDKTNLSYTDENGYDALFHAVSLNEPQIVSQLIRAGSKVDRLYDSKKESALFEASRLGSVKIIEILLKKNSKLLKLKNSLDETVLFEAVRSEQSHLVKYYVKRGLSLKDQNREGKKPADYLTPENDKMKKVLAELGTK